MPLGKTPTERYALKLQSACEKITRGDPSLDGFKGPYRIGVNPRTNEVSPGYEFIMYATNGSIALVHASDDGVVTIEVVGDDFPDHLLECVVHRAEILR